MPMPVPYLLTLCAESEAVYPSSVSDASWCVRARARRSGVGGPRLASTAAACG